MVGKDAQCPHIYIPLALCSHCHLWCKVLGCSAFKGAGDVLLQLDRDVEIPEFYIPIAKDQEIGGLQVRVCDVLLMEVLKAQDDTPQDESDYVLLVLDKLYYPWRTLFEEALNVPSLSPFKNLEVVAAVSEVGVQAGDEVRPGFLEHLFLEEDVGNEILPLDGGLLHLPQGKHLSILLVDVLFVADQVDVA